MSIKRIPGRNIRRFIVTIRACRVQFLCAKLIKIMDYYGQIIQPRRKMFTCTALGIIILAWKDKCLNRVKSVIKIYHVIPLFFTDTGITAYRYIKLAPVILIHFGHHQSHLFYWSSTSSILNFFWKFLKRGIVIK